MNVEQNRIEPCIFYISEKRIILCVHMDDMVLKASEQASIRNFNQELQTKFEITESITNN